MEYLVCYDIKSSKLRGKVAKYLESVALRRQYSVFICREREASLEEIQQNIMAIIGKSTGAIVSIYPFCRDCSKKIWNWGNDTINDRVLLI